MLGAVAKTYYAEKFGIDPKNMVVVSVMPCLAKKYEAARPELGLNNVGYVDYVITTRELGRMVREAGISFTDLPDEDFDSVLGASTGASVIFGASGGVIEAACRTAAAWLTGKAPENVEFTQLRGMDGVREATVSVAGLDLKIAVASGLGNARKLLEAVRDKKASYHAIEIMACPQGCVGGGGQPYHNNDISVLKKRTEAIYAEDRGKQLRMSHENPEIIQIYKEFFGEPYSHKAHELLHTGFTKREL
jgi:iron only hydrogenase large subunit-like protein